MRGVFLFQFFLTENLKLTVSFMIIPEAVQYNTWSKQIFMAGGTVDNNTVC